MWNRPILSIILVSISCFLSCSSEKDICNLSSEEAISEIEKIEILLNDNSPYMNINNVRVKKALDIFIDNLNEKDKISKNEFSNKLKSVLAELGDRHFLLEYQGECNKEIKYYLPFSVAPWEGDKAIALIKKPKITFSYFLDNYPLLISINDQEIESFLKENDPENKHAPNLSKQALGIEKLNEFHKIKSGFNVDDKIKFTFSSMDSKSDTTMVLSLTESKNKWRDVNSFLSYSEGNEKINSLLFKKYENEVAYIKIPEMYSYSKDEDFFKWLNQKMDTVRDSNALILDLRNNSGGNRDLIDFFSKYFIAPNKNVIGNLSRYRGNVSQDTKEGLQSRNLFAYDVFKDDESKQAIDSFSQIFKPAVGIDEKLYSEYYYMVMSNKDNGNSHYFNYPVYIMTNEMTFSAASVFASSFKYLDNINIVGVSTDGASGMKKTYELPNSEIRITMSHMLSYQKDGELFDGTGTAPDIEIKRSVDQILGLEDFQLKKLLEIINSTEQ